MESYELIYRHDFRSKAAAAYDTAFRIGPAMLVIGNLFRLSILAKMMSLLLLAMTFSVGLSPKIAGDPRKFLSFMIVRVVSRKPVNPTW